VPGTDETFAMMKAMLYQYRDFVSIGGRKSRLEHQLRPSDAWAWRKLYTLHAH